MEPYAITIGRELGSGGKIIGEQLAKELNIPIYDRRLIKMAAQESGFSPEMFRNADERTSYGMMSAMVKTVTSAFSNITGMYDSSISDESLFKIQSDIILQKTSTESCIIVGRCADYILRKHPRHLNLFIRANMDERIQRVRDREILSADEARDMILAEDKKRAEYHDFYCETNWGDSRAYDLCINSSILGVEGTAQFLLQYIKNYFGL
ncbi:MAG: cytidylate kinase-like family protein [Prevotellaceae bacterium]|nr:cytidylate kinase-like family protein [Candidatus Colivivens caballi]